MSNIERLLSNTDLMLAFQELNEHKGDSSFNQRMAHVVKSLTQLEPTHSMMHDVVHECVGDERVRTILMHRLHLVEDRDIVCELSQGRIDSESGTNACAAICYKAATHYLDNKPINSEEDIYQIIREGIQYYRKEHFSGKIEFSEILERDNTLKLIYPELPGIEEMRETLESLHLPIDGNIGVDLDAKLGAMEQISKNKQVAGILTCHGETLMIAFNDKGEAHLFDSHGRKYNDMDLGASFRFFKDRAQLASHLETHLFKKGEPYQILFIT